MDLLNIEGFKIPQGFYLHQGHTWIKLEEGGEARQNDLFAKLVGLGDRRRVGFRFGGEIAGVDFHRRGSGFKSEGAQRLAQRFVCEMMIAHRCFLAAAAGKGNRRFAAIRRSCEERSREGAFPFVMLARGMHPFARTASADVL